MVNSTCKILETFHPVAAAYVAKRAQGCDCDLGMVVGGVNDCNMAC